MRKPENPFQRKQPWCFRGKGPGGRNLCHCGCGREVQPPRRTAFSDECVSEYARHNDPTTIRRIVLARDRAVCSLCGVDTELQARVRRDTRELYRWLCRRHAEDLFRQGELMDHTTHRLAVAWGSVHWAAERLLAQWMQELGWEETTQHHWEADHIIPVVEGGGGCGPEGYRTLCLPCHHLQTKALAGRRTARRKQKNITAEG